jgi:hypothetical protein
MLALAGRNITGIKCAQVQISTRDFLVHAPGGDIAEVVCAIVEVFACESFRYAGPVSLVAEVVSTVVIVVAGLDRMVAVPCQCVAQVKGAVQSIVAAVVELADTFKITVVVSAQVVVITDDGFMDALAANLNVAVVI